MPYMRDRIDQVKMSNAKVTLANITNRIPDTYNTNEGGL